ncbi:hypothetical protein OAS48_00715 [Gammaproteobacteria bacterium]|nr:hypothetical protein [Gammaproteobacteria bacterium]
MAYLNLYLTTGQTLSKEDVVSTGLLFNKKFPVKWTDASMPTLENLLCNLVKYENKPVLYEQRAKPNVMARYNPMGLGHKKLIDKKSGVLWKLVAMKLIKQTMGVNPYFLKEDEALKTSEIKSTSGAIEFAKLLGITKEKIYEVEGTHHVILKKPRPSNTVVDYKDSKLTQYIEDLMSEYCNYLANTNIKVDGEKFTDIKLRRTFRDVDGDASFKYGGRSGGYWMELKEPKRERITLDQKKVVRLDYKSSQINVIYAWKDNHNMLDEDQYSIQGYNRKLSKQMHIMMLNNSTSKKSTFAFMGWLQNPKNRKLYYLNKEFQKNPFNLFLLQKKIRQKHPTVAHLFYNPKVGLNVQFLESALIFEIAVQLCRRGIPALTVHDEIIVPRRDEDEAKMVMYSTYIDRKLYKALF